MVERLVGYDLPIFIVDDGSDESTQQALATVAKAFPTVRLSRLSANGGKGAAVMHGLRQARAAGFSHALQIDADGQHEARDVPRFLAAGRDDPQALVYGCPIYDASIPKGRLYGRYVTHFWVSVETLSRSIADSMCGYRLYPLASTCALIDRVVIPPRMEFDIEIMVRLAWAGLRFQRVDTRVIYPADGVSHFDLWRDNLRISRMHARLTCGMLLRLPLLLWRKLAGQGEGGRHWSRLSERGSVLGLKMLFACYRLLGERVARALLYPIVGYFFLTGHKARAASIDHLRRVRQLKGEPPPRWRDSFWHMLAFGQSGLDKLAAWLGELGSRDVDFPGRPELLSQVASGRGAVIIGSHLGNLEMMRALAINERQAPVNAVVFTHHARRFNELLRQANAGFGVNLIEVSHLGPETAILLKEKIDRGELVVIVGDRTPATDTGSGRICRAGFLGAEASFAQGPFILASLLECPVYLLFCLRQRERGEPVYRIHLERFAEQIELPRKQRQVTLQKYVEAYARRLEHYCLEAPEQWFNFYDFWQLPAVPHSVKVKR